MKYYLVLRDCFENDYLSHTEVIETGNDSVSLLAKCVNLNTSKRILGFYYDVIDETGESVREEISPIDDFMQLLSFDD